MTCEGTKHRFNLSRLADGDAPWLCECGAVEWMEENGNLDCVSLDLEKVLRTAQETEIRELGSGLPGLDPVGETKFQDQWPVYFPSDTTVLTFQPEVQPDHLIEPPGE